MKRRLIVDGNAVYELDEDCMLQKRLDKENAKRRKENEEKQEEKSRVEKRAE